MIPDMPSQRIQRIFLFLLVGLCIAFGFDLWSYFFLYTSGLLGFFILLQAKHGNHIDIDWKFYIPILFFAYLVVTPGNPLKDLHVAGIFSAAFFAGATGWLLFRHRMHTILFFLPASLVAQFLFSCLSALIFDTPVGGGSERLVLNFSSPAVLGELSALGIFFLLCFPHPNLAIRLTGHGLIAMLSVMIVLSVGRAAYLGMASALLVFVVIRSWTKAVPSIAILLAAGCAMFPFLPDSQQTRIASAFQAPLEDPTFKSRLPIWDLAFQKITEAPFLGHGLRSFKIHYKDHLDKNYEALRLDNPHTELRYYKHPHSIYLAAIYGWGIVGTGLLIACWGMAIRYGHRQGHHLMLYVTAFMLAFGLFEVRFLSRDGAFFLLFPMGLVFSSLIRKKAGADANTQSRHTPHESYMVSQV